MKILGLSLILVGATLALVPVEAQGACQAAFTIVGKSDNLWHVGSNTNPTLTACPGEEITITAQSETGVHNIVVEGVSGAPAASDAIDEGASFDYKFTAPASGSGTYVCQFHSSTMKGTLNFASASTSNPTPTGGNGEGGNDTPGIATFGVLVALMGAALLVGRRRA